MRSTLFVLCVAAIFFFGCAQQLSVEVCEQKPVEYGQRDQCFRALAKSLNDYDYCNYIEDDILRDYWCYREIAYDTKNNATCELINDSRARQSCYDIISGKQRFERGI